MSSGEIAACSAGTILPFKKMCEEVAGIVGAAFVELQVCGGRASRRRTVWPVAHRGTHSSRRAVFVSDRVPHPDVWAVRRAPWLYPHLTGLAQPVWLHRCFSVLHRIEGEPE